MLAFANEQIKVDWETRHLHHKEILASVLESAKLEASQYAQDFDTAWQTARLAYYSGFFILDDSDSFKTKSKVFDVGMNAATIAIKLKPDRVEGHYWWAVNAGGSGLAHGIMSSLGSAKSMKAALDKAIKIDKSYHMGGPLRVRGRLYFKLPGSFISFGDNKLALADLLDAKRLGPKNRINYLYLAAVQAKQDKAKAIKTLEEAKLLPEVAGVAEEKLYKSELAEFEKKLK